MKALVGIGGLALCAFAAWLLWPRDDASPGAAGSDTGREPEAASTDPVGTGLQRETAAEAASQTGADGSSPALATVRGRCVDAGGGEPLSGCSVRARHGKAGELWGDWPVQSVLDRATTGADGRFSLQLRTDGEERLSLRIEAAGRAPIAGRWPTPEPGGLLDLGDVPLVGGVRVTGRVMDEQDAGVGEVTVLLSVGRSSRDGFDQRALHRTTTDALGRFVVSSLLAVGEWYVGVDGSGALLDPRTLMLSGETAEHFLAIRVQRPDPEQAISGIVVDEMGRSMEGVRLAAYGEGSTGRAESRADGTFVLPRAGPWQNDGTRGVRLQATDRTGAREQRVPASDERVAWGKDDVRVVMGPLASHAVVVLDADGAPVHDFDLLGFRVAEVRRRETLLALPVVEVRGEVDGRGSWTGLRAGDHGVVVRPLAEGLAPSGFVGFEVVGGGSAGETVVRVEERVPCMVEIVDTGDAPVASSRLELVQGLRGGAFDVAGDALPIEQLGEGRTTPEHVALAVAVTDARGRARLAVGPGEYDLRVRGDSHVPRLERVLVTAGMAPVRIVVEAGAVLEGRLTPATALARMRASESRDQELLPAVVVEPADGEASQRAVVGADGAFRVTSLPPGRHAVVLRYWLSCNPDYEGVVHDGLVEVTLARGERRALDIDLARHLPGTLRGRVLVDGEPLLGAHLFARRAGQGPVLSVRVRTDEEGWFASDLPPGDYGVSIALAAQPGPGWDILPLPGVAQVTAGEVTEMTFHAARRRIRVRVLDASGRPLADRRVQIDRPGYFRPGALRTDGDGWVEILPAPYGAFHLRVGSEDGEGTVRVGPVEVPDDRITAEVEARPGGG